MMCRDRIRIGPAPNERLASTKARERSDNTCPRTMRAIVSQDTAPRATNSTSTLALVAGERAPQHPDDQTHTGPENADHQRNLRPMTKPHQQIPTVHIRAEPMLAVRRLKLGVGKLFRSERRKKRIDQNKQTHEQQEPQADDGWTVVPEA